MVPSFRFFRGDLGFRDSMSNPLGVVKLIPSTVRRPKRKGRRKFGMPKRQRGWPGGSWKQGLLAGHHMPIRGGSVCLSKVCRPIFEAVT